MALSSSRPTIPVDAIGSRMAFFRNRILGKAWPNIIAGRQDVSGRAFAVQCPFERGLVTSRLVAADKQAVTAAALAAGQAQGLWAGLSPSEKADCLNRLAASLVAKRADLALALVFERAATRAEALAEVDAAVAHIQTAATQIVGAKHASRPLGVVALLTGAGEPLALFTALLGPALAAGNAVLLRPGVQAGLVTALFMEAVADADLPQGLINMLGGEEAGGLLAECLHVDGFIYAGNLDAGLKLQRKAMAALWPRPFHFWKKGRFCAHVTASADLDQAASILLDSAFVAAGAGLGALSVVMVEKAVGPELALRLKKGLERFKLGNPLEPSVGMSQLADGIAHEKLDRCVKTLRQRGRILAGGEAGQEAGLAVRPVIAADIPFEHNLWREESFLPVLLVDMTADLQQGLARAAGLPQAIGSMLFAKRAAEAKLFRENVQNPALFINPSERPCAVSGLILPVDLRLRSHIA